MSGKTEDLSGIKKSAILLVLMGPDRAGRVLKNMKDEDVEQLTLEIANLDKIDDSLKENILSEFFEIAKVKEFINKGGVEYAKSLLETAFGPEKAIQIIERLVSNLQVKPFDFLRRIDVSQMVNVLQNEHPQTISLVLCYLPPSTSSQIIANLPEQLQVDIIKRISIMNSATPDIVKEIEAKMKDRLSTFTVQTFSQVGGIEVT
ncbi:MAG TPA: flagellar motor switch protein FliG, partial [Tepiditoga sp.]|nr:flagellar motor switch protein FliG [Tepiditoga sp.]